MRKSRLIIGAFCAEIAMLGMATSGANASLVNRGGGMVYDDVLGITWLSNADVNGQMDWATANAWANNLVFGGHSGWRLPKMDANGDGVVVDCRFMSVTEIDCRDNEYGYMYQYNGVTFDAPGDFSNIGSLHYWSSTENQVFPSLAWIFNFTNGFQGSTSKITANRHAWAVHDGDIAAVPIPAAIWLFVMGSTMLLGVGANRRRS